MQESTSRFSLSQLVRWAGTLLALALMVWLLVQQGWQEIWADIQKIGLGSFLLALGLTMGSRVLITLRWHVLLTGVEVETPLSSSFKITFAGLFGNNFLPSTVGGDVVRLAGAVRAGVDGALAAASLVMDRLVGMAGMAVFLPFGLPSVFAYTAEQSLHSLSPALSAASAGSLLVKITGWVKKAAHKVWQSTVLWVKRPRSLLLALIFTFGHMACLFGIFWVILKGLDDSLSFWTIGGLWSMVYFVTLVPVSINGLGVQELSTTFAFHVLGGVSEPHSLTLALLYRTLMMAVSLPGAFFVPGMISKNKKSQENGST